MMNFIKLILKMRLLYNFEIKNIKAINKKKEDSPGQTSIPFSKIHYKCVQILLVHLVAKTSREFVIFDKLRTIFSISLKGIAHFYWHVFGFVAFFNLWAFLLFIELSRIARFVNHH